MPSRVDEPKSSSRFELPALNLNFGNITDGTDIPPPPASPLEKPVEKPAKTEAPAKSNGEATKAAAPEVKSSANGNQAGTKRPADDIPPSPVSTRHGSLRRLLSRTMLNNSYAEGEQASQANGVAVNSSRPPSRDAYSLMDERKSKRSSGWFKRLRGGDAASRRSSLMIDTQKQPITTTTTSIATPRGPPPPMIPELKELEKDESSFGNDLFKNIK